MASNAKATTIVFSSEPHLRGRRYRRRLAWHKNQEWWSEEYVLHDVKSGTFEVWLKRDECGDVTLAVRCDDLGTALRALIGEPV
jgi:hypothetical protein